MRFWKFAIAACVAAWLAGCGGGGGGNGDAGGSGSGSSTPSSAGSWLTFSPSRVDLTMLPGTSTPIIIDAVSSRTIAEPINVAIIDAKGVIVAKSVGITPMSALRYSIVMFTQPALAAGVHSGSFEVRLCYDSPLTCARPVEGSPWQLPYTITVSDPASLSYQRWEEAQTTPGFLANFALSQISTTPVVVSAGFYSGVMETWTSADLGSGWRQPALPANTMPMSGAFALASDGKSIYLSGGQAVGAYGKLTGNYLNHVWKFDGTSWREQTPAAPFAGRRNHVMAKVGDTLYLGGGRNGSEFLQDLWASSDDGVTWRKISASLPAGVSSPSCALNWRGSLLLVGNQVATSADGVAWTVHAGYPPRFPQRSTQCAVLNDRLFINSTSYDFDAVSSADLQSWKIERPMGGVGNAPGMAAIDGRLLITSGDGTSQRTVYRTVP